MHYLQANQNVATAIELSSKKVTAMTSMKKIIKDNSGSDEATRISNKQMEYI